MYTCYHCAKTIKGEVKHTGIAAIAYKTGFNFKTSEAINQDFPKAFHPVCYAKAESQAAKALAV